MFKTSVDVQMIVDRLETIQIGQSITYAALSSIIGTTVQHGHGRTVLNTARRILHREQQIVFGILRNAGLRRLTDHEKVAAGGSHIDKVRRAARRGARIVAAVDNYAALSPAGKIEHNAKLSVLGAIEAVSSRSSVRKIEARVSQHAGALPLAATLEAFKALAPTRIEQADGKQAGNDQ